MNSLQGMILSQIELKIEGKISFKNQIKIYCLPLDQ